MRTKERVIVATLLLAILLITYVVAQPLGPDEIASGAPERRNEGFDPTIIQAQAGNVTQIQIFDNRTTTVWQGYFGNVTSAITLGDGGNNSLFFWQLDTPSGEVYAANDTITDWGQITCVNFTANAEAPFNQTSLEGFFNISADQSDGINETFNDSYTSSFQVGSSTIDSTGECPLVYTNVNNESQSASFQEVLLTDNQSIIFTALLESGGTTGFDGNIWDFQLLVAENQAVGATPYYFYVEIS